MAQPALVHKKSAFTPITNKQTAAFTGTSFNLFEPSPIQKLLYHSTLAQHHQDAAVNAYKKVFSPMKITPTLFLKENMAMRMLESSKAQY